MLVNERGFIVLNGKTVVLIGVGGIGYRHFQALMRISVPVNIWLVDPSPLALQRAKEYLESISNKNIMSVVFSERMPDDLKTVDLAIIATTSLPRRAVIESLLSHASVRYLILEKFLFPKVKDYGEVVDILGKKDVVTYVNCPRRIYPGYKELRKRLAGEKRIEAHIGGVNWGLGCNAIHYLDILDYLVDSDGEKPLCSGSIDDTILASKRGGYIEFSGKLIGSISDKLDFEIESASSGTKPLEICIATDDTYFRINEQAGKLWTTSRIPGVTEEKDFPVPFQSELTHVVAERLFTEGVTELTPFNRSCELHLALLKVFLDKFNSLREDQTDTCPIT